eukprot:3526571-Rhodomonas_salina.1
MMWLNLPACILHVPSKPSADGAHTNSRERGRASECRARERERERERKRAENSIPGFKVTKFGFTGTR